MGVPLHSKQAQWGGRGVAIPMQDLGAGRGWVSIVQEAGWASGPVWMVPENLAPHWDSKPGPSSP